MAIFSTKKDGLKRSEETRSITATIDASHQSSKASRFRRLLRKPVEPNKTGTGRGGFSKFCKLLKRSNKGEQSEHYTSSRTCDTAREALPRHREISCECCKPHVHPAQDRRPLSLPPQGESVVIAQGVVASELDWFEATREDVSTNVQSPPCEPHETESRSAKDKHVTNASFGPLPGAFDTSIDQAIRPTQNEGSNRDERLAASALHQACGISPKTMNQPDDQQKQRSANEAMKKAVDRQAVAAHVPCDRASEATEAQTKAWMRDSNEEFSAWDGQTAEIQPHKTAGDLCALRILYPKQKQSSIQTTSTVETDTANQASNNPAVAHPHTVEEKPGVNQPEVCTPDIDAIPISSNLLISEETSQTVMDMLGSFRGFMIFKEQQLAKSDFLRSIRDKLNIKRAAIQIRLDETKMATQAYMTHLRGMQRTNAQSGYRSFHHRLERLEDAESLISEQCAKIDEELDEINGEIRNRGLDVWNPMARLCCMVENACIQVDMVKPRGVVNFNPKDEDVHTGIDLLKALDRNDDVFLERSDVRSPVLELGVVRKPISESDRSELVDWYNSYHPTPDATPRGLERARNVQAARNKARDEKFKREQVLIDLDKQHDERRDLYYSELAIWQEDAENCENALTRSEFDCFWFIENQKLTRRLIEAEEAYELAAAEAEVWEMDRYIGKTLQSGAPNSESDGYGDSVMEAYVATTDVAGIVAWLLKIEPNIYTDTSRKAVLDAKSDLRDGVGPCIDFWEEDECHVELWEGDSLIRESGTAQGTSRKMIDNWRESCMKIRKEMEHKHGGPLFPHRGSCE